MVAVSADPYFQTGRRSTAGWQIKDLLTPRRRNFRKRLPGSVALEPAE